MDSPEGGGRGSLGKAPRSNLEAWQLPWQCVEAVWGLWVSLQIKHRPPDPLALAWVRSCLCTGEDRGLTLSFPMWFQMSSHQHSGPLPLGLKTRGKEGASSRLPGGKATEAGLTMFSSLLEASGPPSCQLLASSLTIPFIPSCVLAITAR